MEWSLDGIIEEALSVIRKLTACALATTAVAAVVLAALIGAVDHDQCQGVFGSDGGRSDLAWLLRSGSGSLCNTKRALMARKGLVTDFAAKRATAYLAVTVLLSLPALWYFRAAKQRQTEQTAALWWPAQVAVVTGGRGGLGTALVGALLKAGCGKVVSVDCSDTKVLAGSTRGHVTQLTCDVSRAESVQRTADHIRAHIGAPTILISNAGVMVGKRVLDLDEGDFEQTLAVNVLATFYWTRALLPDMLDTGSGHILATGSIMSYLGISQLSDYVASKHALAGFMESLRYELDKHYRVPRIATTLLVLGHLHTPLFARIHLPPLGRFLMPAQHPSVIAADVVRRLALQADTRSASQRRNRHAYIFRPRLARYAPLIQALPRPLRNLAQFLAGADEALQPV